jgi:hypothetical protein
MTPLSFIPFTPLKKLGVNDSRVHGFKYLKLSLDHFLPAAGREITCHPCSGQMIWKILQGQFYQKFEALLLDNILSVC